MWRITMNKEMTLSQDRLKILLNYDPETGIFTWRVSGGKAKSGAIAGKVRADGYRGIGIRNKQYMAHRLAFLYMHGFIPKIVDHINRDGLDNRWENLRSATHAENMRNSKIKSNNSTGAKGVYWNKQRKKYRVLIWANGKRTSFGSWDDPEAAELVASLVREKYHGDFHNHGIKSAMRVEKERS